jgi:thiamine transporter
MSKKSNAKFQTRTLAEIIVFAALSGALYAIRPFSLPYGGSITLGSMVPVMWLSLRRGVRVGVVAGILFGLIALPIDVILLPYSPITNPIQVFLEYPIAFGVLGLAGISRKRSLVFTITGVGIGIFIKLL